MAGPPPVAAELQHLRAAKRAAPAWPLLQRRPGDREGGTADPIVTNCQPTGFGYWFSGWWFQPL